MHKEKRFTGSGKGSLENCCMRYETSINQPLEEFEHLVIGGVGLNQGFKEALDGDKLVVTRGISCSEKPHTCICQTLSLNSIKSENRNVGRLILDYIKTIYIIATSQKSVLERYRNLISFLSIVFQYKVFSEFNETDISPLSDEEKVNSVRPLTTVSLSLCEEVCKPLT